MPTPANDAEAGVSEAIGQADFERAITLLDRLYGAALYRHLRLMMGSDDVADDVFQMTMVQAFQSLASFAGRSSLRTWLYSIARHRALDVFKAERRRSKRFTDEGEGREMVDLTPDAAQRIGNAQLVATLETCVQKLPPQVRMVVLLRFQEGFSYDEIARTCQEQPATLRAWVSRALPRLRKCINSRGTP